MYQVKNNSQMKNVISNIKSKSQNELINELIFEEGGVLYVKDSESKLVKGVKMLDKLIDNEELYEEDLYHLLNKYYTSIVRGKAVDTVIYSDLIINLMGLEEKYNIDNLIKGGGR